MRRLRNNPGAAGTLVGLAVTAASTIFLFTWGRDNPLELQAFNSRIVWFNDIEPSPKIVHVDIDDGSLERIGKWPWPRRDIADLLRTIHELGAALVCVDLLLSEKEWADLDLRKDKGPAGTGLEVELIGEISEENWHYGDLELAEAIRTAGNVLMSVQLEVASPGAPPPFPTGLRQFWLNHKDADAAQVVEAYQLDRTEVQEWQVERELLRMKMVDLLLEDFTLSDPQLGKALGIRTVEVAAVVAGAKRLAAHELVERLFEGGRRPAEGEVLTAILGEDRERRSADRADVIAAYDARLALVEFGRVLHPLPREIAPWLSRAYQAVPLLEEFAAAARNVTAVNFSTDSDGMVRRVPIVIDYEGLAVLHMGFAAAAEILDLDVSRMSMPRPRRLSIPRKSGAPPLKVPLDGNGNLIIPWAKTAEHWREGADFPHIPAAKVWSIVDARRQLQNNQKLAAYRMAEVISLAKGEVKVVEGGGAGNDPAHRAADNPYRAKVNRMLALERGLHMARLVGVKPPGELEALATEALALRQAVEQEQRLQSSMVRMACQQLAEMPEAEFEADPALREERDRFLAAKDILDGDIAAIERANETLNATIAEVREQLAGPIKDKYVFLGYAATAQGDIVATPIDPRTNGVMCHAHVLNAFLQNRFIGRPAMWMEVVVCVLLGALAGLITATRGPRIALLLTLIFIGGYFLFNGLGLFQNGVWFALAAVVITLFFVWAFVTLFRQFTAERDKRLFRKQLSQYTSPAIAAKIAESPEAAQAFKTVQTRDVTCIFSDLAGFTSIAETEDAAMVQHVLNTYLQRMSQVIWDQRGLINKFMGDGIMAFFNPSVDPLPDHPRIACRTALAMFDALDTLKREQAGGNGEAEIFQKLHMRIGIACGPCMNGDLGSELKADYTVIGDVVNLAARLEPANKVFGTRIMVSDAVRREVQEAYEFRHLADLQVKGKARTVPVYEIVCPKGRLMEEEREYIARFEAGVELYKQGKWDECIVHFTRSLSRRFDDLGASRYIDACQEFKTFPPEENWNGALELKEK